MSFHLRSWLLSLSLLAAGCGRAPEWTVREVGALDSSVVDETSGLMPSRQTPGLYWVHNDSGGDPLLVAIQANGREVGQVWVEGTAKRSEMDWEDACSLVWQGEPLLVVADIGDNPGQRKHVELYVVAEPRQEALARGRVLRVPLRWKQRLLYPDGPRDAESFAIDAAAGKLYVLSKRDPLPILYEGDFGPSFTEVRLRAVGKALALPKPGVWRATLPSLRGKYYGHPTAMDFSPDGRWAVVLTYGNVCLYRRRGEENWGLTLGRKPVVTVVHEVPQAEAACFSSDGRKILLMGEGLLAPVWALELPSVDAFSD